MIQMTYATSFKVIGWDISETGIFLFCLVLILGVQSYGGNFKDNGPTG